MSYYQIFYGFYASYVLCLPHGKGHEKGSQTMGICEFIGTRYNALGGVSCSSVCASLCVHADVGVGGPWGVYVQ